MRSFQEISSLFEKHLFGSLPFPDDSESLYGPCKYLLEAGGKRVRPSLSLMANELFGPLGQDAFHAAMAIELFHNFTLVHDDIMDESPLRRGKPSVHMKYGLTAGILSGDVMGIYAYECLGKIQSPVLPQVFRLFNKMAIEVCEGQQMDMDFERRKDVSIEEYLEMIKLKTSVLLATSLQIGALVAGASDSDAGHIYQFGIYLGLAFQLQDDHLDTFGDEALIGKRPGGDIRSNKKTFLMLKALENSPSVGDLIWDEGGSDEKFEKVKDLYVQCSVDAHSRDAIERYASLSQKHLDQIDVPEERKRPLRDLAQWLLNRQY